MRRLAPAVVSLCLALPMVVAAATEPTCARQEPTELGWGSVRPYAPAADDRTLAFGFTEGYVGFGIDRVDGENAAVVDARVLQVTHDAGCSWQEVVAFDDDVTLDSGLQPSSARFVGVDVADGPAQVDAVAALVFDLDYGTQARVRTVLSFDGGQTFEVAGEGLPDQLAFAGQGGEGGCGPQRGCQIRFAPSNPEVVYVSLRGGLTGVHLYRSDDAGRTFRQVNGSAAGQWDVREGAVRGEPRTWDIAPDDHDVLWGGDFREVISSTDGGRRWTEQVLVDEDGVDVLPGAIDDVLAIATGAPVVDQDPAVVALIEVDGTVHTVASLDKGRTWTGFETDLDAPVLDLAGSDQPGTFLATTADGAFRLDLAGRRWEALDGGGLGPLYDANPLLESDTVWFRGPSTLPVRGDLTLLPPPVDPRDIDIAAFDPLNPVGDIPGRFVTEHDVIHIPVGQETDVNIVFDLPKNDTPLDVFFLFDQSGSMQDEMDALAKSMGEIVRQLARRRVDVWAGLGGYSGRNGYRYERHADIQDPSNPAFQRALASLYATGGNETPWTALHQVATGTGLDDNRMGFGPREGWQANWRPGAVRVVVHLTDEPMHVEEFPTRQDATDALVEKQIRVIGLISSTATRLEGDPQQENPRGVVSLDSGISEDDYSYGDVATLARVTGALAGPSGVDCGGDGEVDIEEGGPIACYLSPLQTIDLGPAEGNELVGDLATVMVEILAGVTEIQEVVFHSHEYDVVRRFAPASLTFDIRKPRRELLQVTLGCDASQAGQVHHSLITAVAASRHLAATTLAVACGPVAPGQLPAPVAAPRPVAAAAAPAPPPPPVPVPAPAAAQGLANAANPATAQALTPQVGVAAAAQSQRQAQAASIGPANPSGRSETTELAFSARPTRNDPGPAVVLAGAVMASAAGAVALRRQRSGAPGRVRA